MNHDQKLLVKETWQKVLPIQDQAAELFYGRLFSEHPEVQPYFKGDMQEQGRKLMKMINAAVNGLDNLEALLTPVRDMGARHAGYGVKNEDYDKVGAALLWTLEQGLGDLFTPKVKEAWTLTYTTIAGVMQEGAEAVAEPA